jgi:hypothetical protein
MSDAARCAAPAAGSGTAWRRACDGDLRRCAGIGLGIRHKCRLPPGPSRSACRARRRRAPSMAQRRWAVSLEVVDGRLSRRGVRIRAARRCPGARVAVTRAGSARRWARTARGDCRAVVRLPPGTTRMARRRADHRGFGVPRIDGSGDSGQESADYSLAAMLAFESTLVGVGSLLILFHRANRSPSRHGVLLGVAAGLLFTVTPLGSWCSATRSAMTPCRSSCVAWLSSWWSPPPL